jgi:hypothetical protein
VNDEIETRRGFNRFHDVDQETDRIVHFYYSFASGATTPSIMTPSMMTLSMIDLIVALSIKTSSIMTLSISSKGYYAECRYAECRYAECRHDECHGTLGSKEVKYRSPVLKIPGSIPSPHPP